MTRIAWSTDIHLNFLGTQQIEDFLKVVQAKSPDIYIISGDIGEAPSIYDYLRRIADTLTIPVYFVLGNHDFYHGGIQHVRAGIVSLIQDVDNLHWLNTETVVQISENVAMVGHDGWSDGRYGNFKQSPIVLNDYVMIQELANLTLDDRLATLQKLGDEAGEHIREVLPIACTENKLVFVVTHAPPFQEACWHEGESATDDNPYLPHFTCKAVGDALREIVPQYPDCQVTVLCGHTHGSGIYQALPNLNVITGGAEYGKPIINRMFAV